MATLVGGYVPNFSHVVFFGVFVSGSAHLIQGPYSHPTDFILITYSVSYYRLLISIILCDCVCKGPYNHPTDFILITYISELFQTFDKYNSV